MKKNFRGPTHGYSSVEKQKYRQSVWSSMLEGIERYCKKWKDIDGHFLVMPSRVGEEIDVLVDLGVSPDRIVAVDESPAMIATSLWRKKHPAVKFYGCKLSDVHMKLKRDKISLLAANLDLCNNFSKELLFELYEFLSMAPKHQLFAFTINMMKGREQTETVLLLNELKKAKQYDCGKIESSRIEAFFVINEMSLHNSLNNTTILSQGEYLHNRTPMTWASFMCIPNSIIEEDADRMMRRYKQLENRGQKVVFLTRDLRIRDFSYGKKKEHKKQKYICKAIVKEHIMVHKIRKEMDSINRASKIGYSNPGDLASKIETCSAEEISFVLKNKYKIFFGKSYDISQYTMKTYWPFNEREPYHRPAQFQEYLDPWHPPHANEIKRAHKKLARAGIKDQHMFS